MNLYKRAWVSIRCRPGSFAILAASIFAMALLLSGALSIRQAITSADTALRVQMPAVATLVPYGDFDVVIAHYEQTGEWPSELTPSQIREVGYLDYVYDFDFSVGNRLYSTELRRVFDKEKFSHIDMPDDSKIDSGTLSQWGALREAGLEHFFFRGVHNPDILDAKTGLIDLTEGRAFTQAEVESLSYVAVVSRDFLRENDLELGGFASFDYRIYVGDFEELLYIRSISLEIVGVFDNEFVPSDKPDPSDVEQYLNQINQIYVPNLVVESTLKIYQEVLPELNPDIYKVYFEGISIEDLLYYDKALFLLHDPIYLTAFRDVAHEVLPNFWRVDDFTSTYSLISSSMEILDEIALQIVIGTLIATVVIVSLVIMLVLHDRRREAGIYLALGEKKSSVVGQFLIEIMFATVIGMTLGLFAGNMLGAEISGMMIEQDMIRQLEDPGREWSAVALQFMGYRAYMTPEEMLAVYEVRLGATTVVQFSVLLLSTALFATVIPLWSIVKMKPREILSTLE